MIKKLIFILLLSNGVLADYKDNELVRDCRRMLQEGEREREEEGVWPGIMDPDSLHELPRVVKSDIRRLDMHGVLRAASDQNWSSLSAKDLEDALEGSVPSVFQLPAAEVVLQSSEEIANSHTLNLLSSCSELSFLSGVSWASRAVCIGSGLYTSRQRSKMKLALFAIRRYHQEGNFGLPESLEDDLIWYECRSEFLTRLRKNPFAELGKVFTDKEALEQMVDDGYIY
ncbi:MAG TPA: hypothetical protein QGF02_00045 [Candidatus Babeliales bacterium]|nr:hypothetical protein [Candidatus Babeliales bacterium]